MVEPLPGARGGKGFKRTATLVPRRVSMVPDNQMDSVIGQMVANGLDEDAIHAALETNGKDRDPPLSFLSPLPPPCLPALPASGAWKYALWLVLGAHGVLRSAATTNPMSPLGRLTRASCRLPVRRGPLRA